MAGGGVSLEQLQSRFNSLRRNEQQLLNTISQMQSDLRDHKLVIDTITPMDPSRRCFRLISGVLVERTVGEALPALQANYEGINKTVSKFLGDLESLRREMFEKQLGSSLQPEAAGSAGAAAGGAAAGGDAPAAGGVGLLA